MVVTAWAVSFERRGRDAKLVDWLDAITADCAKKRARQYERSMWCTVPAIAEGAIIAANVGNFVLLAFLGRGKRNLAVVGLALLLSCCTNERETKILLGIPDTVEQTPDTDADRGIFACRQYGFVPGTQQWDECMKYVGSKRPPLLRP